MSIVYGSATLRPSPVIRLGACSRLLGPRLVCLVTAERFLRLSPDSLALAAADAAREHARPAALRGWTLSARRAPLLRWHWTVTAPPDAPRQVLRELSLTCALGTSPDRVLVAADSPAHCSSSDRPFLRSASYDLVLWDTTQLLPHPLTPLDLVRACRETGALLHLVGPLLTAYGDNGPTVLAGRHDSRLRDAARRPPGSATEQRLLQALSAGGLSVETQRSVGGSFLDMAYEELGPPPVRLDIEVDGRLYHQGPDGDLRPQDKARDRRMRLLGWEPVRFWADDVDRDPEACVAHVVERIKQLRESSA